MRKIANLLFHLLYSVSIAALSCHMYKLLRFHRFEAVIAKLLFLHAIKRHQAKSSLKYLLDMRLGSLKAFFSLNVRYSLTRLKFGKYFVWYVAIHFQIRFVWTDRTAQQLWKFSEIFLINFFFFLTIIVSFWCRGEFAEYFKIREVTEKK